MAEGLLLVAETVANGDMYAATRFLTSDPVLWLETGDRRILVVTGFDVELARRSSPATEVWALEEVVAEERAAGGRERELRLARALNAVRRAGLDAVRVPYWFPLDEADHLRANGIGVRAGRRGDDRHPPARASRPPTSSCCRPCSARRRRRWSSSAPRCAGATSPAIAP